MADKLTKLRIFALEVALGGVIGSLGLLQLVYGVPPVLSDPEMLRKLATSLITIGGHCLPAASFASSFPCASTPRKTASSTSLMM